MKRYVLEFQQYMWAENDEEIIKEAKKFADSIGKLADNSCSIRLIVEQQSGTIGHRKVSLTNK